MKKGLIDYMPNTKKILEGNKNNPKPTLEERVEAVEQALLHQLLEVVEDV